jgi:AcrR family transcriptional regulator
MPRPLTPLLSREGIVAAALQIIDSGGVEALSMRRLAGDLGVSGPSLYHHFAGKDEILDAIVEQVNSEIELEDHGGDWEKALSRYAYQLRSLLTAHPHIVEFVALRPVTNHAGLRIYEHLIGQLGLCGWSIGFGRDVVLAVENLVYGAALMANAPMIELTDEQQRRYPLLARVPEERLQVLPDDAFEIGFGALVSGLRALTQRPPAE